MDPPPRLESLRKHAKRVLRQHAARQFTVAERIRRGLPAFAGRTDRAVLDAPFQLGQAQELIAREQGFESWAQMKKEIESMSHTSSASPSAPTGQPEFVGVHPQVFVTDMERAVGFYRDELGFTVEYLYGEPAYYGLVKRGAVGLNLRHLDASPYREGVREQETLLAATVIVRDLKPLFVAFKEAGLPFRQTYQEQPWGAHDFIVADPDGNLIHFASAVEDG